MAKKIKTISEPISKSVGGESVNLSVDVFDNGDSENNIFYNLKITTTCHGTHSTEIAMYSDVSLDTIAEAVQKLKDKLNEQ